MLLSSELPGYVETQLPATKTSSTNGVHYTPFDDRSGIAIIDQSKGIQEYHVEEFRADGGRGFRFTKRGNVHEVYNVFLPDEATADAGFAWESCECHGFNRHGHCKHINAARAITDRGLIGVRPVVRKPEVPAAPAACIVCRKRPRQRDVFKCLECESRM